MLRFATALVGLLLAVPLQAQTVTVETIVPAGSQIADALAIGPDGALYGSRFGSFNPYAPGQTVSRVDLGTGTASIYASGFSFSNGLAFRPDGTLYVVSYYDAAANAGRVSRVSPDGTVRVVATLPDGTTVSGAAYDAVSDKLYITSYDSNWIKTLSPSGTFTDVVEGGDLNGPAGLAFDDQNRLHVANFNDGKIFRVEGTSLVPLADVRQGIGFLAYGGGRFFATGIRNHRIYAIAESGDVTTIAGRGVAGSVDGDGATAQFDRPNGIVATAAGDTLYVSDAGTRAIRRITFGTATAADDAPPASALLPLSPNPTASEATVRFQLAVPADVELAVFDALGRRVRVLEAGPWGAGLHEVPLDTSALAPGVYLVTLRHGDTVESRTLVRR